MSSVELKDLAIMSTAELKATWRDCYRQLAPDIGPALLRRGIAYRLQVRVHGELPVAARKRIEMALRRLERTGEVADPRNVVIKPGTRLVREWRGNSYHVLVLDEGFEHDGRRYGSLSQIARAITGTHWSGPRFFGLNKRNRGKKLERAQ